MYVLWNELSVLLPHYTCCVLRSLATIFDNQSWSPTDST